MISFQKIVCPPFHQLIQCKRDVKLSCNGQLDGFSEFKLPSFSMQVVLFPAFAILQLFIFFFATFNKSNIYMFEVFNVPKIVQFIISIRVIIDLKHTHLVKLSLIQWYQKSWIQRERWERELLPLFGGNILVFFFWVQIYLFSCSNQY